VTYHIANPHAWTAPVDFAALDRRGGMPSECAHPLLGWHVCGAEYDSPEHAGFSRPHDHRASAEDFCADCPPEVVAAWTNWMNAHCSSPSRGVRTR
jgi:hypothetical protein